MTLTPADIHNAEFGKASFGRRGYEEDDVDALLDEATREMTSLLEENTALQNRLHAEGPDRHDRAAVAQLSELTADLAHAERARERAEHQARLTRRRLDEVRQDATRSGAAGRDAPAEPMLRMAQRTADGYLHEAHETSQALLAAAHERADRTLHEARDTVDAIDRKSRHLQDEAAAELAAGRAGITRDIDELARFIGRYRAGLEHQLRHQGQLIDEHGRPRWTSSRPGDRAGSAPAVVPTTGTSHGIADLPA